MRCGQMAMAARLATTQTHFLVATLRAAALCDTKPAGIGLKVACILLYRGCVYWR